MTYNEDEFLLISGIQHFSFCRRQWALIHIENQWAENLRTVEGGLLHQRAHDETIRETAQFLSELKNVVRVDLMNYHEYGRVKYEQLGMPYLVEARPLPQERLDEIAAIFHEKGVKTQVGG